MGITEFNQHQKAVQTEAQLKQVRAYYKDYPEQPFISSYRDLDLWLSEVDMDRSLLVPKKNMQRGYGNVLPGDVIALWRVQFGTLNNESIMPQYFEFNYGIDAKASVQEMINKGYIRVLTNYENLDKHRVTELKTTLKYKGVKIASGIKKDGIIALVKDNFSEDELEEHLHIKGYALTSAGEEVLTQNPEVVDKHPKKKY